MIYLKNVRIDETNNMILADYYPEDSTKFSPVSITNDYKMVFSGMPVGYYLETKNHLAHAKWALMDMVEGKREIKDCQVMWC